MKREYTTPSATVMRIDSAHAVLLTSIVVNNDTDKEVTEPVDVWTRDEFPTMKGQEEW